MMTSRDLYDLAFAETTPPCVALHLMRAADELVIIEAYENEAEWQRPVLPTVRPEVEWQLKQDEQQP